MPGVTKYNLVDDAHDLRIPMHNDDVFKHGVCFEAKVGAGGRDFLAGRNYFTLRVGRINRACAA